MRVVEVDSSISKLKSTSGPVQFGGKMNDISSIMTWAEAKSLTINSIGITAFDNAIEVSSPPKRGVKCRLNNVSPGFIDNGTPVFVNHENGNCPISEVSIPKARFISNASVPGSKSSNNSLLESNSTVPWNEDSSRIKESATKLICILSSISTDQWKYSSGISVSSGIESHNKLHKNKAPFCRSSSTVS